MENFTHLYIPKSKKKKGFRTDSGAFPYPGDQCALCPRPFLSVNFSSPFLISPRLQLRVVIFVYQLNPTLF